MAVLQQPVMGGGNPFAERVGDDLAPVGTWVATLIDVKDEFGVVRAKYEKPNEMEKVDLTTFLFGFRDEDGQPHMIASKRMKISGNDKSALYGFLKSMRGCAPTYGEDYCALKGRQYLLTVEHIQRKGGVGVFAAIASLSPVPSGFAPGGATAGHGNGMAAGTQPRPPAQPVKPAAPAPKALADPIPF
jgi:hypothetical protein